MRIKLHLGLCTVFLAALPALAQFQGVLEMKTTTSDKDGTPLGGGTMTLCVSKAGTRSEMNMQHGTMGLKMVMLQKSDAPDKAYTLNESAHTYVEIDLAKARGMAAQQTNQNEYTVQKLGQEKLLGYNTQHVLVKEKNAAGLEGMATEMWTAKDFLDYETFSRLQIRHGGSAGRSGLVKALKDAGAEGMPLKYVSTTPEGIKTTMEVLKAERKSLPASTFEIPPGYTKSEGGLMDMMGGATGPQSEEVRKKMDETMQRLNESLKNMTPEQRQRFQDLMKQRGAHP
jgi:hypothetical protein